MSGCRTEQERFWSGDFGDDYIDRNRSSRLAPSNLALFSRILSRTGPVDSVLELGANIGLNLDAVTQLLPGVDAAGVEINDRAVRELRARRNIRAFHSSMLEWKPDHEYDLVFTKGVLIHISPDHLPQVYDLVYGASRRFVLFCEYFNPTPVEVTYRGHSGKLFKRDFAADFLDRFADVEVVDYGFVWRRDPAFTQDDMTWFLLRKVTTAC